MERSDSDGENLITQDPETGSGVRGQSGTVMVLNAAALFKSEMFYVNKINLVNIILLIKYILLKFHLQCINFGRPIR